jgi:hypothetical protein
MRHMFVMCLVLLLTAAVNVRGAWAGDEKPLTTWQKAQLISLYPGAIHQLPLTTIHEGSHWLVARAFGGRPGFSVLPRYRSFGNERVLDVGYVSHESLSPGKEALFQVAPYLVQLLIVDRTIEASYKNDWIRRDSFGDKYLQTALLLNVFEPLENSITEDGDMGILADQLHVNRFILGAALQAAYFWSASRILKARGHKESVWAFYVHFSF